MNASGPNVEAFHDPATFTVTYLVYDPSSKDAVIIDPVLDYNPVGSQTSTKSAKEIAARVDALGLQVHFVLETHAHADHISSAQWFKAKLGAKTAIGERITVVQETFKGLLDLGELRTDGTQFDRLLREGETLEAGALKIGIIETPGHTPACLTYQMGDMIFTGDALFMPDYGTGRCDFPKGSSGKLYDSVQKLYALPDDTRVFVGHDYMPGGRELEYETTIGASKAKNPQLRAETTREEFVAMRDARDATLAAPKLLFQSVQVNIDAGRLPKARGNGVRYLGLPLNLFGPTDDLGERVPDGEAR